MENTEQSAMRSGANDDTIGNMSREEFDEINESGAEAVAAIVPTSESCTENDRQLILQVAAGGMMQLEISRVAVDNATDEEVLALAEAEVEEQTGLSDKLQEIADAKGLTLPSEPDAKTQALIEKLENMSAGDNFDRAYVQESGVNGHEKLDEVMSKVQSEADDADLITLASTAHPLVLAHLQVSRDILNKLSA